MFSRCIRCNKPFPKNSEIAELPVGRRIAFDTAKGRLWVVCTHCGQWNLVPLEEPELNGAECATASVRAASTKVSRAESEAHAHSRKKHPVLRPWERLVRAGKCLTLDQISPEDRLALEMAVSEEVEQHELIANAESAGEEWPEQEEIAGISDSLFVAPEVERKLQELKKESSREEKPLPKRHNEH